MTIHEVVNQLFNLSVDGKFNGEKMTRKQLEYIINSSFRPEVNLKLQNRLVMTMKLKDGEWLFTIDRFNESPDGFDYTIPDNRVQENNIAELLFR